MSKKRRNNDPIELSTEDFEELMGMIDTMVSLAVVYIAGKTGKILDGENLANSRKFEKMFDEFAVNGDEKYLFKLIDDKYLEGWVWLDD